MVGWGDSGSVWVDGVGWGVWCFRLEVKCLGLDPGFRVVDPLDGGLVLRVGSY